MKIILDINDNKADSFIQFIKGLDFIKIRKTESADATTPVASATETTTQGKGKTGTKEFRKLLLSGPIMNDEQLAEHKKLRTRLNKWRQK